MKLQILISILAVVTSMIGCSMPDDVREAKDTSKDMSSKLDRMQGSSDALVDRTSNLFSGARKDAGFERVTARYEDVLNAKSDTSKIIYASALATSYEFQQWTGTKSDTIELKDRMNAKAMRDLLPRFEPLIAHDYSPDTYMLFVLPATPDNDWKSAASMAVTLGEIDEDQQIAAAKAGVREESLYSLIVKGLQYKNKALYTKNIPEYAKRVLDFEDEAVLLLQLRHNYFIAMVMSRFSDFAADKMTNGKFNETMSWINSRVLRNPIDMRYVSNIVKLQDQAVLWLQQAQETQQVLQQLGYPIQFNRGIMGIFAAFRFSAPKNWVGSPVVDETFSDLNRLVNDLQKTYVTSKAPAAELPKKLLEPAAIVTPEELALVSPGETTQSQPKEP